MARYLVGNDDGIVNQQAQGDDHAKHRHLVNGVTRDLPTQHDQCGDQGQNSADHQSHAPAHHHEDHSQHHGSTGHQIADQGGELIAGIGLLLENTVQGNTVPQLQAVLINQGIGPGGPAINAPIRVHACRHQDDTVAVDQGNIAGWFAPGTFHPGDIANPHDALARITVDGDCSDTAHRIERAPHLENHVGAISAQRTSRPFGIRGQQFR